MTVVRELVTKLNFRLDRKGIQNFNRTVSEFKSQMLLVSGVVAGFTTAFVKTLQSFANGVTQADDMARAAGIATNRFLALEQAASRFRISPEQFRRGFNALDQSVRDARFGFGRLFEISQQLQIPIRQANGELKGTEEIFELLIEAIGNIDDETTRIDIAKNLFGEGRFADIQLDQLREIRKEVELTPQAIEQANIQSQRFEQSLNRIRNITKDLALVLLPPVLERTSNLLENLSNDVDKIQNKGFFETVGEGFQREGFSGILQRSLLPLFSLIRSPEENNRQLNQIPGNGDSPQSSNVNVNTRIEIQPPEGSEDQQRQFFEESARVAFEQNFNDQFNIILNNFPQVT